MSHPDWVHIEDNARVHPSVQFIPYKGMETTIGKGTLIDSGAKIYGGVKIDEDCIVGHYTVIRGNCKIGVHSIIGNLTMLEGSVSVGHHTTIHSQCHLAHPSKIGNYVFMGPMTGTTNDRTMHHYRGVYSRETMAHFDEYSEMVVVEDAAQIGEGSKLLAGITVGTHATIGLGSVVTNDIPPYAVAYGNPAKVRRILKPEDDVIVLCPEHPDLKVNDE